MFLTRLGFGSKAVVTGDITQIDLPNPRASGYIPVKCSFTGQPDLAILDTNE
jgi:phosphate starvation-inducible PhoH-like protein